VSRRSKLPPSARWQATLGSGLHGYALRAAGSSSRCSSTLFHHSNRKVGRCYRSGDIEARAHQPAAHYPCRPAGHRARTFRQSLRAVATADQHAASHSRAPCRVHGRPRPAGGHTTSRQQMCGFERAHSSTELAGACRGFASAKRRPRSNRPRRHCAQYDASRAAARL
jgi:hypothetical protein